MTPNETSSLNFFKKKHEEEISDGEDDFWIISRDYILPSLRLHLSQRFAYSQGDPSPFLGIAHTKNMFQRGFNPRTAWYKNPISIGHAVKMPGAEAAVNKEWNKLKNFLAWDFRKVEPTADVVQDAGARRPLPNVRRSIAGRQRQERFVFSSRVHGTRRIGFPNGRSEILGHDFEMIWNGRRSSRRSLSAHTSSHEGRSRLFKRREKVSTSWIKLPRNRGPRGRDNIEEIVVPLEVNLYGHPLAGPLWQRAFGRYYFERRLEESETLGCLYC